MLYQGLADRDNAELRPQVHTRDVRAVWVQQKLDCPGNVVRIAKAAKSNHALRRVPRTVALCQLCCHLCFGLHRNYKLDPDTKLDVYVCSNSWK